MRMQLTMSGLVVLGVASLGASAALQKTGNGAPDPGRLKAERNYQQVCQPCHGPKGDSPLPMMSLSDGEWKHGSSTQAIAKTIAEGIPGTAMLPNKDKFTQDEIDALAELVRTFDPKLKPETTKK